MNIESTERDRRRMISFRPLAGLSLTAPLVLAGCSHAPEYSIFGSFFPVWIFSRRRWSAPGDGCARPDRSHRYR